MADFGARDCVDIMLLHVLDALENLNLKENNKGNEPPPPPLQWHLNSQTRPPVLYLPLTVNNSWAGLVIVISGLSLLLFVYIQKEERKYMTVIFT